MCHQRTPVGDAGGTHAPFSQIQIVVQDRLQAAVLHVFVHCLDAAAVLDFELFVTCVLFFRACVFRLMVANAC